MNPVRRVVPHVVFDTSTLVSAALRVGSAPYEALHRALGSCVLFASESTLAELDRVLNRDKFDRYLDLESRRAFVALIRRHFVLVSVDDSAAVTIDPPCRDPKDNQFLALAVAAEAELLVSSDEDLLILHPWNGIAILTPTQFDTSF